MAKQVLNKSTPSNRVDHVDQRNKINDNFTELYDGKVDKSPEDGKTYGLKDGVLVELAENGASENISTANLTFDSNRTHDLGTKILRFFNGLFEIPKLTLDEEVSNTIVNTIWNQGKALFFTDRDGVSKRISTGSNVYVFTASANFNLSTVREAMNNDGISFNDSHIIISLGASNITCNIDLGALLPNSIFTMGKRGTGSLQFTSVRTLDSGEDSITIMNGNEASMSKIEFGTTKNFLTIRNL